MTRTGPTRIARWLVRHYPKPWRERYAGEVLALLDDTTVQWQDLVDLAYGLLIERVRSILEPGARPTLTLAMMLVAPLAMGLAPVLLAVELGMAARYEFGTLPRWTGAVGSLLPYLATLVTCVRLLKSQVIDPERELVVYKDGTKVPWWVAVVSLLCAVVLSWSAELVTIPDILMIVVNVGHWLVMGDRWNRMTVAIRELFSLRRKRKWAPWKLIGASGWRPPASGLRLRQRNPRCSASKLARRRHAPRFTRSAIAPGFDSGTAH